MRLFFPLYIHPVIFFLFNKAGAEAENCIITIKAAHNTSQKKSSRTLLFFLLLIQKFLCFFMLLPDACRLAFSSFLLPICVVRPFQYSARKEERRDATIKSLVMRCELDYYYYYYFYKKKGLNDFLLISFSDILLNFLFVWFLCSGYLYLLSYVVRWLRDIYSKLFLAGFVHLKKCFNMFSFFLHTTTQNSLIM